MRQHAELLVGWQGIPVFFMIVLLRNRDVLHLDVTTPKQELADAKCRLEKLNRMSDAVSFVRSSALLEEIAAAGDAVDAKQTILNRVSQLAARHQQVKACYGFIYEQYRPEAWS